METGFYHGGALNNLGHVVAIKGGMRSYLLATGHSTDLGALPGYPVTLGWGINDQDDIVGWSLNPIGRSTDPNLAGTLNNPSRAFLWRHGKMTDLGLLPGYSSAAAAAINNKGQIVGRAYTPNLTTMNWTWPSHAVLWDHGHIRDLGVPPGCVSTRALAINNQGQVVGTAITADSHTHAFLWQNGKMSDLGLLPGGTVGSASTINDHGQIAGDSEAEPNVVHAVIWSNHAIQDLGDLSDTVHCNIVSNNNYGISVGDALQSGDGVGIYQSKSTGIIDLNSPTTQDFDMSVNKTFGINDRGQILVWGARKTVGGALALLTPKTKAVASNK